MNTENSGNLQKMIAVIIIAAIALFFVLATVARGFDDTDGSLPSTDDLPGNVSDSPEDDDSSENPDLENPDNDNSNDNETSSNDKIVYKSYLTGLEIEDLDYPYQRLIYICDSKTTLYGASAAELVVEIPCGSGNTRYALYVPYTESLGKIGAIAPTKAYVSNTCRLFGGIICAYGVDDSVPYSENKALLHVDLSKAPNYSYKENVNSVYTRYDMLEEALLDEKIDMLALKTPSVPFSFSEDATLGKTTAKIITVPYSDNNRSVFVFDEATGKYRFVKNGKEQHDQTNCTHKSGFLTPHREDEVRV